jgi:hypothetical protein
VRLGALGAAGLFFTLSLFSSPALHAWLHRHAHTYAASAHKWDLPSCSHACDSSRHSPASGKETHGTQDRCAAALYEAGLTSPEAWVRVPSYCEWIEMALPLRRRVAAYPPIQHLHPPAHAPPVA